MIKFIGKKPLLVMGIGMILGFLGWAFLDDTFVTNSPNIVGISLILAGVALFGAPLYLWYSRRKKSS
jgi:hypothetical protein